MKKNNIVSIKILFRKCKSKLKGRGKTWLYLNQLSDNPEPIKDEIK